MATARKDQQIDRTTEFLQPVEQGRERLAEFLVPVRLDQRRRGNPFQLDTPALIGIFDINSRLTWLPARLNPWRVVRCVRLCCRTMTPCLSNRFCSTVVMHLLASQSPDCVLLINDGRSQ